MNTFKFTRKSCKLQR